MRPPYIFECGTHSLKALFMMRGLKLKILINLTKFKKLEKCNELSFLG